MYSNNKRRLDDDSACDDDTLTCCFEYDRLSISTKYYDEDNTAYNGYVCDYDYGCAANSVDPGEYKTLLAVKWVFLFVGVFVCFLMIFCWARRADKKKMRLKEEKRYIKDQNRKLLYAQT